MPWHISKDVADCSGWAVVKDSDSSVAGCHETEAEAKKHMAALYANEPSAADAGPRDRPPLRDDLVRGILPYEYRLDDGDERPIMRGYFARFNEWTRIDSDYEGTFMESIAPGAFRQTLATKRDSIKVLFQHGRDPDVGDKPIASITQLREDDKGAYYEAALLDGLPPLISSGLAAGQYGASFRFRVMKQHVNRNPEASDDNPDGLMERTIQEADVHEFGPVTFPAYSGATATLRSLTDDYLLPPDRLQHFLMTQASALMTGAGPLHSEPVSRPEAVPVTPPAATPTPRFRSREDYLEWLQKSLT